MEDDVKLMLKEANLSKDEKKFITADDEIEAFYAPKPTEEQKLKVKNAEAVVGDLKEIKEKDFSCARDSIKNSVKIGQEALESLLEVAQLSKHPYSFEVMAKLMDSLGTATERMLNMYIKLQEIEANQKSLDGDSEPSAPSKTQNNIIFNGTTTQLMELIKAQP